MLRLLARMSLAAATITAVMTVSISTAMAAGTWTVTGGPSFTASASSGTTFTFTDTTHSATITCTKGTAAGSVTDQSSGPGTFGTFTSSGFTSCTAPVGCTVTIMLKAGTTAIINGVSFSGGVATGTITGLDLILTFKCLGSTCTAEVRGTIGFTYTNSSHLLQLTTAGDSLTVTSTSGSCAGIIQAGDNVTLSSGSGGWVITGSPTISIQISEP
jgi:hypothetical protein